MPIALEPLPSSVIPPHKRWTRDECAVLERARLVDLERYELIEGERGEDGGTTRMLPGCPQRK